MRRRTGTLIAAGLMTASLTLAGCGSSSSGSSGGSSSGGSASGGSSSSGSSYTPLTKSSLPKAVANAMKNVKAEHMDANMGSMGQVTGDANVGKPIATKMKMNMNISGHKLAMNMIYVGGKMYMQSMGGKTGGKYMVLDPSKNPSLAPMFSQIQSYNPSKVMTLYTQNVKKVVYKGDASMGGRTLHHYVITVNTSKLAKKSPSVPSSMSENLYLDDNNLPREMKLNIMGKSADIKITPLNQRANITAPPKSKQISPKSMAHGMG